MDSLLESKRHMKINQISNIESNVWANIVLLSYLLSYLMSYCLTQDVLLGARMQI